MIVVVGAEKGGVGKTSIATNMAGIAAKEDIDVLLLDTDPQGSSTGWVRIRNEEGVEPKIPVLTLSENPLNELASMAKKFELIIVDIGAQNYKTMVNACEIADLVLVPTGPDQFEVESAVGVFRLMDRIGNRHRNGRIPAHILLNRIPTNSKSKEEAALREYLASENLPVFDACLRDRSSWRNSRRAGLAVHELKGKEADHKAAAEMAAIFAEAEAKAA